MTPDNNSQYTSPDLIDSIDHGLKKLGKDPMHITPRDLSAVDQLHTGGAPATLSLVQRAELGKGAAVLDAGCGIGGSSRLLAQNFGLAVQGIDLSNNFIGAAEILTRRCGLDKDFSIGFQQGSLLDLPYEDNFFQAALCQHVLLNIPDKKRVVAEISRVLAPGGSLILHEIVDGPGADPLMPVPWAETHAQSLLDPPDKLKAMIMAAGFTPVFWEDQTERAALWWKKINEVKKAKGKGPLNPGLVFGKRADHFGMNMEKNFSDRAVICIEAVFILKKK